MKNITPNKLFSKRIHNYKIKTRKSGLTRYINLDNAATTPPLKEVEKYVHKYLSTYGSVHRGAGIKSQISTDIYEQSKQTIKKFTNARKDDYIIYTANTTGAINSLAYFFSFLPGKIAVSEIEHSSSWLPWVKDEGIKSLGTKRFNLKQLKKINQSIQILGNKQVIQYRVNDKFEFDLDSIENLLKKEMIKALILTASSNITGYCPPIRKIGKLAKKYNAYFIVDACQYLQHHKINIKEDGIDFLVASGHKFYAPYGGGFLIGPKKFLDCFLPYQIGGGNLPYIDQKNRFIRYKNQLAHDPGTPNAIGAISMAKALKCIAKIGIKNIEKYEHNLAVYAYRKLSKNKKIKLHVSKKHVSTVLPFTIEGKCQKEIAQKLNDDYGIGVREGSFCVYNVIRKLKGIKDDTKIANEVKKGITKNIPSVIRASISLCNTKKDIDIFTKAINEITNEKNY